MRRPYSSVPKRLRVPAAKLAHCDPGWIQAVLLGFTRDGQHLLTYSTRPLPPCSHVRHESIQGHPRSNASDGNETHDQTIGRRTRQQQGHVQGQNEADADPYQQYELQIWSLHMNQMHTRRIFQVPLFRASSRMADGEPAPLWETGDERLRITTCETPCRRLLLVHARDEAAYGSSKEGTHQITIVPSPLGWERKVVPTHALHICYHTTTPHPPFHPALCFLPPRWLLIHTGTGLHVVRISVCRKRVDAADFPLLQGPCCEHLDAALTEIKQHDPTAVHSQVRSLHADFSAESEQSSSVPLEGKDSVFVHPSIRCVQHFDIEMFVCSKLTAQTSAGYRLSDYELLPVFLTPTSDTACSGFENAHENSANDSPYQHSEGTSILLVAALLTPTEQLKQSCQISGSKSPSARAIALLVALTIPSCKSEVLRTVELPCSCNQHKASSAEIQWSSSSLRAAARQHASLLRRRYSIPRSNNSLPFTLSNASVLDTGQSLNAIFNHAFPECILGYASSS